MSSPTVTGVADAELEPFRRELTGYCYRMLGSGFEAEDAVQETMVRAWRSFDAFEGRSSLRSWLYRIATNVCLDMLKGPQRRARPMDLGPSSTADTPLGAPLGERAWVQPIADVRAVPEHGDPAELAAARDSIRLAFVAALQHLPPRQRAVLILREVLHWHADEVADLLGSTVASVNSALQRARATLSTLPGALPDTAGSPVPAAPAPAPVAVHRADPAAGAGDPVGGLGGLDAEHEALLARYVDAFERYDIEALVALIHEDATFTMPPFALWLSDRREMAAWYTGQGAACDGSKLLRTAANGCAAFGHYKPDPAGGRSPFALQVIETGPDGITGLHHFLQPQLFEAFGLPTHLD